LRLQERSVIDTNGAPGRGALDRRRFLLTTATGLVAAGTGAQLAAAATDDDLAVANFGLASSYLAADFYAKALASGKLGPGARGWLRAGRSAAVGHARELTTLLTGAGDTPATAEDFELAWPAGTFTTAARIRSTGVGVLRPMRAAYQQAAAIVTEPTYRVLFASLAASYGEQLGHLSGSVESFPKPMDLETASAALESYLG
jgi:hypothetical protein